MVTALGKEATRCLKPFSVGLRRQVVGKEHQAFNETALLQQRVESIQFELEAGGGKGTPSI